MPASAFAPAGVPAPDRALGQCRSILTYEHLLNRVLGDRGSGDLRPTRTIVPKLRLKLGDDASSPAYIFAESRVGYRMPKGQTVETEES